MVKSIRSAETRVGKRKVRINSWPVSLDVSLLLSLQMGDLGGGMQMDCLAISAN